MMVAPSTIYTFLLFLSLCGYCLFTLRIILISFRLTEYIEFEGSEFAGWIVNGINTSSIISAAHSKCKWFTFTAWFVLKSRQRIIIWLWIDDQRLWTQKYASHQAKGVQCWLHSGYVCTQFYRIHKCIVAIAIIVDYISINNTVR